MDRNEITITMNWAEMIDTVYQASLFEIVRKLHKALPMYAFMDAMDALLGKNEEAKDEPTTE